MNLQEYMKVKNYSYREYCDYLKAKYGEAKYDYCNKQFVKDRRVTRTKEGLVCHHIYEDTAIMLCNPDYARLNPFRYQQAENLCYCDYLEHLFLHILICENPSEDHNISEAVGIGGVTSFLIPELNDLYSGWRTNQRWRQNCLDLILNDKDVYMTLIKRFKESCSNYPLYDAEKLLRSFNAKFGLWTEDKNRELYNEISNL